MGIFTGTEKRAAPIFPEPPIPPFPGTSPSGFVSVSSKPDLALTVPTVWACVTLVAGTVSSLRMETFRQTSDAAPGKLADPSLLRSPSGNMTPSEWLHMLVVSLLLRGNAIGRISARDYDQRATQIDLLHPDAVKIDQDRNTGRLKFTYRQTGVELPTDDVWHVPWLTLPGSRIGLSPIAYAASVLQTNIAARQFALDFFDGGGVPKAVLSTDQQVTQDQAQTIKDRIMASFRKRDPIVLGAGLTYQQISVKPEESQFLATQQADVAQIARYFGVPPEMVGGSSGTSMTYSNVEQRSLDFLTYGLAPLLKRIEDALSTLLPQPQFVKFRTTDLLRTDAETQAKVDVLLVAGKIAAPSEIRTSRGWQPLTKAQKDELALTGLSVGPTGRPSASAAPSTTPEPVEPVPATEGEPSA